MCMTVTKKSRRKTMFKVFCGCGDKLHNYHYALPTANGYTRVGRQLRARANGHVPQPCTGESCGVGFIHGFANLNDARRFAYDTFGTTIVSCRCLGPAWEGEGHSDRDMACRRVLITRVVTTRESSARYSSFK